MLSAGSYIYIYAEILMFGTASDHTDFSESTEEIAPLTEEEKKAKLEALRLKLKEKRAGQAAIDMEEAKRNEVSSTLPSPSPRHLQPMHQEGPLTSRTSAS